MPAFLYGEVQSYISALYEIELWDRIFYFNHGTLNRELDRAAEAAGIQRIRIHDGPVKIGLNQKHPTARGALV